ncbi:hypothetical protein, partial [Alistipes indistinctus]|uniref:hypothetical protein n=1 Tax=Alistipes indistinctus TaxID=626932 RepID=UPI003AB74BD2
INPTKFIADNEENDFCPVCGHVCRDIVRMFQIRRIGWCIGGKRTDIDIQTAVAGLSGYYYEISSTPYVEFKRGVTDKDGVCRFEFKSGELSEYNVVDGNYFEGYAVVLDPTTGTSVGARNFLLQQGKTLPLAVYVRQDE